MVGKEERELILGVCLVGILGIMIFMAYSFVDLPKTGIQEITGMAVYECIYGEMKSGSARCGGRLFGGSCTK